MVVSGVNAVREALLTCPERIVEVVFAEGRPGGRRDDLAALASRCGVVVRWGARGLLDRIAGTASHQGVAARLDGFPYVALSDIVSKSSAAPPVGGRIVVVLDHIEDPQNLGAIIRSAAFFGCSGVVIPKARAARVTSSVVKASAGCVFRVPVAMVPNIASSLDAMKRGGFWVMGAVAKGGVAPWEAPGAGEDLALVIGNENKGISKLVGKKCDMLVSIPSATDDVDSLNASAAAAVLIYELRHRKPGSRKLP